MIASWVARSQWPRARAASPVSHWLWPLRVAMRPSSEVASLSVTSGRPRPLLEEEAGVQRLGLGAQQAELDLDARLAQLGDALAVDPLVRDRWSPTTTRRTPAWISAIVQGGVRP